MNDQEMRAWIDGASYEELLQKWRHALVGDPLFQGLIGDYYWIVMERKKSELPPGEQVRASKAVG